MDTIQVEVWCDHDLYVWLWFAGRCGTKNDKNMVSVSPLFSDILSGRYALKFEESYRQTDTSVLRNIPYFLADGIYPSWPIFVKAVQRPGETAEHT